MDSKEERKKFNKNDGIIGDTSDSGIDAISKKMTLLVKRVVVILLICYVPFIVWRVYYLYELIDEHHTDYVTAEEGFVDATVRILFAINSCINPIIYAQTIPAFKDLVRGYIVRST